MGSVRIGTMLLAGVGHTIALAALDDAINGTNDTAAPKNTPVPTPKPTTTSPPPSPTMTTETTTTVLPPTQEPTATPSPPPTTTLEPTPPPTTTIITTTVAPTTTLPPTPTPTPETTPTPTNTTIPTATIVFTPSSTPPTEPPPDTPAPETSTEVASSSLPPTSTVVASTNAGNKAESLSAGATACIIIGSLIVVCVAVIVVLRRRQAQKKRLSDKQRSGAGRTTQYSVEGGGVAMIDMTSPHHVYKHKSPVPVLSLRHYDVSGLTSPKEDSIHSDHAPTISSSYTMFHRQPSDSIDSYQPSPHRNMYRDMMSPATTMSPSRPSSMMLSDQMSPGSRHLRSDLSSFSINFSRVSSMSAMGPHTSHLLRNSDDLSVYSDRTSETTL
ncbi:hypothetical protein AeMF1_003309 [Aphanomyces euteiches]|nr:hypothetical protein AeMF1_003309 [Aphanomyces euteiches]KAH9187707.1 hypothetical protein AeNC1_010325 [Aphanomyces euteiches]